MVHGMNPRPIRPEVHGRGARTLAIGSGFTVLALMALATPPRAQAAGISLGWSDCRVQGGPGAANRDYPCVSSILEFPLLPGFVLAAPVDSVLSMELVIDVDVAADALPDWWRMDPNQCNETGWSADTAPPPTCADAWAGEGVASVQGWLVGSPGSSPRHGRLLVAATVVPDRLGVFDANVAYTACRVLLRTTNVFTCAGCAIPACLVFNSLLIRRAPGSSVEEVFIAAPESPGLNMVLWQGGSGADCLSVPVRRATWGAVKALYR
jgi:hypothetical protein